MPKHHACRHFIYERVVGAANDSLMASDWKRPALESFRSLCVDILLYTALYNLCERQEVSTALLNGLNRQPQPSNCRAAAFPGHFFAELPVAIKHRGGGHIPRRGGFSCWLSGVLGNTVRHGHLASAIQASRSTIPLLVFYRCSSQHPSVKDIRSM